MLFGYLFLVTSGPPENQSYFTSTDDLISTFNLQAAYDKYVRPLTTPVTGSGVGHDHGSISDVKPSSTVDVKGKGKEVPPPATPAADGQDDDDEGGKKGDKKKKNNNYRHLIRNIPGACKIMLATRWYWYIRILAGKHSLKKDDYLTNIMQIPPKERVKIAQFDSRTQRDAFMVTPGGIPGVRIIFWISNLILLLLVLTWRSSTTSKRL
jgi:hypothetical protein